MLTATLSSNLKTKWWARMWWKKITIRLFRIRISRQNIKYHSIFIDDRIEKIVAWTKTIDDVMNRYFIDKYVMYCNFRVITKQLVDALNCEYFDNQVQDKAGIFNRFRSVDESIIIIISAFEMRIDVNDIRIVFHIDRSRNLLNYVQKSERAKRNKLISEIIIVLRKNVVVENQNRNSKLMKSFVQSEICKDQILNDYLNKHVRIECEKNEQSCEYCAKFINVSSIQNQEFELTEKNDFDNANNSYLLKQQRKRDQIQKNHRIRMRTKGETMKNLQKYLNINWLWCSICRWFDDKQKQHVLYFCRNFDVKYFQERYVRLRKLIRNHRLLTKFENCATCFASQAWCNRLKKKNNTKLSNRENWRSIEKKKLCQYNEILLKKYVINLTIDNRNLFERNLRMKKKKLNEKNEMNEAKFLKLTLKYEDLKTNELIKKLIEIKHI